MGDNINESANVHSILRNQDAVRKLTHDSSPSRPKGLMKGQARLDKYAWSAADAEGGRNSRVPFESSRRSARAGESRSFDKQEYEGREVKSKSQI